jgi:hypothetical protein
MEIIMILINRTNIQIFLFLFIIIFSGVSVAGDNGDHHENSEHLVLKLHGTGFMYSMEVPGMEEGDDPMEAMCFELDVIDMKSNEIIGSGTDCMSNVEMKEDGNVALVGTTYFYLPEGQLIARGAITVQPVPEDFNLVSANGHPYSHITGSANTSDHNSIIGGTGKFENSSGRMRLSGMVDMTQFTMTEDDPITFSCLFVVDLD